MRGPALGLLMAMALCAPAGAATVHHPHARHHHSFRHAYGMVPPSFGVPPRRGFEPRPLPPVIEDQTPSYDDPSKFGGG